jgi:PIN domain nuclease of toxin-antitoxin system
MQILFDTHAFIWWDDNFQLLSSKALAACQDKNNTLLLSIASIWEMQIKIQLGKLNFTVPLETKIRNHRSKNKLQILPIMMRHIFTLNQLPHRHRAPFDRLLIAQAIYKQIPIMSHDSEITQYQINIIW